LLESIIMSEEETEKLPVCATMIVRNF
jgi:hypothetical protein